MLKTSFIGTPMVRSSGAVDVEEQPGRIRAEAGEQFLQTVSVVAESMILSATLLQRLGAEVAAVLDDYFEAARRAQALQGRLPKTLMRPSRISS